MAAGLAAVSLIALAACGSNSSDTATDKPAGAQKGGTIVVFQNSSTVAYIAQWKAGLKKNLEGAGYKVQIYESNFDQTEQNSQIQQALTRGSKPVAWVVQPADAAAASASLVALKNTGVPVFMANEFPTEQEEDLIVAYAGIGDVQIGKQSAELSADAAKALTDSGHKLHSPGGNAIIVTAPATLPATYLRNQGYTEQAAKENIKILDIGYNAFDVATGQKVASAVIAAHKAEGIDLVFGGNDAIAQGALLALKAAGYEPGKDVMVVGGSCFANVEPLIDGSMYATNLQGAQLEGDFTGSIVGTYLSNPKVKPGTYQAPATPDSVPKLPTTISKVNLIPAPPVLNTEVRTAKLWGESLEHWCRY